jgi:hypothetical protein
MTCARYDTSPVQRMIEAAPVPQCLDEIIIDMHKLPGMPLAEVLNLPPLSDGLLAFMFPGESTHFPDLYVAAVPLPAGVWLMLAALGALAWMGAGSQRKRWNE